MFGGAGREYRWRHGTKKETFAKISEKARKHANNNPYALFADVLSLDEIMASPEVFDPLTRYQCCPPTCGAAAAVLCSEAYAKKKGIAKPVRIAAQAMTTDYASSFGDSMIKMVGWDMAVNAAKQVYDQAGVGPEDVDVVELHDCFTANELLTYEAIGLCKEGEAEKFIEAGDNTYGGKFVHEPLGRPALRGATRSARPVSPNARSSCGSSAARPTSARSTARRSRSSTTSASAARASSRCTAPIEAGAAAPCGRIRSATVLAVQEYGCAPLLAAAPV